MMLRRWLSLALLVPVALAHVSCSGFGSGRQGAPRSSQVIVLDVTGEHAQR